MNQDLLLELKQRAGIDYNPDQEGLDLFAELIIAECVQIADCRSSFKHNSGAKILKHWGISKLTA